MKRTSRSALSGTAVLGVTIAGLLLAASAQAGTPTPEPTPAKDPGAVAVPQSAPAGYTTITSPKLINAAGTASSGLVACPSGTTVLSGGAVIAGSSLAENLAASYPADDTHWTAYVTNTSSTDGTFRIYAVCANLAGYASAGDSFNSPAHAQTRATVRCPRRTVPLGGGGYDVPIGPSVNLNSTAPSSSGWLVDFNNATGSSGIIDPIVVCATKPAGYTVVTGRPQTVAAGTQGSASAACPANTVTLGGGSLSNSTDLAVNVNTEFPNGSGWVAFENNASTSSTTLTAYAICGNGVRRGIPG